MSGAGTPKLVFRCPAALQARMEEQIALTGNQPCHTLDSLSEWIRKAIEEKLDKMKRSREWRRSQRQIAAALREVELTATDLAMPQLVALVESYRRARAGDSAEQLDQVDSAEQLDQVHN